MGAFLRRVRSPLALQRHDGLFTIGNPNQIPWYSAPFDPDRVLTVKDDTIEFRSGFVAHGHSGGALFSQDWYLVGMVTDDEPPGGQALRIDRVLERLRAKGVAVDLAIPVPPPALNAKHQQMLATVEGASDFDAAYVNAQLMAHQEAVALFTSYSSSGDVPQLASFAAQTLPTLQMHLDHVQSLSGGAAAGM